MFEKVPTNPNLVAGEHEVLSLWESHDTFNKLRTQNAGKPSWSFLDGPITANNPMGVHHAWGRTYKDAFQRFFAMTGHELRYQNGFDCQGLWVEVEVEKQMGFECKRDIEAFGLEDFINSCKERVRKYSKIQTDQSIRLGYWMDWDNSYYTMDPENNYTIWSFLKKCHSRELIYKSLDAMPWCPRCGTGISEQERSEGYKDVTDDSVYVKFPLRDREKEFLVVWTTTPWTLVANVAAAVHPELTYVKAEQSGETYYIAKDRIPILESMNKLGKPTVLEEIRGSAMIGWQYDAPFDELEFSKEARKAHRVIAWEEVTATDGTGIVHIAPGCGKDDFELGWENDLPVLAPIDDEGNYFKGPIRTEERSRRGKMMQIYFGGLGSLEGKYAADVTEEIMLTLREKSLYYKKEKYSHKYPHCWRCSTALLFRVVDEWFISMDWRDEIKAIVDKIRWIPSYGRDLEQDWLTNMGDWMISKKRFWGLALPIFECHECGSFDVIGGREELQERAVEGWDEFVGDPEDPNTPHRPWLDAVKISCPSCSKPMGRIPDVGNPWLDAGIVPYSTVHYNTDRDHWEKWVPADLVLECFPGQFRNWFYALLSMSTMMENIPPFRTLLGHALVRDENGEEMHKSTGNAIWFDDAAEKMGSDVMRWLYCRQNPTNNMNFGYTLGKQTERKVFGTFWNVYAFFCNYAILDEFDPQSDHIPASERPEIDRWILSNLQLLTRTAHCSFPDFAIAPIIRHAEEFVDQLSNWYVRRNRRRFWKSKDETDQDKIAAYQTLYEVIVSLTQILAPVIPFLTERIYQNLRRDSDPESVHLCVYPQVDDQLVDEELSFGMQLIMQVTRTGHALREEAGLRVRQPLAEIRVAATDSRSKKAIHLLKSYAIDELNVKKFSVVESLSEMSTIKGKANFGSLGPRYGKDVQKVAQAIPTLNQEQLRSLQQGTNLELTIDGASYEIQPNDVTIQESTQEGWVVGVAGSLPVALSTTLTQELIEEGWARDTVRQIQQIRKDLDLNIEDRIVVQYWCDSDVLVTALNTWSDYVCNETLCDELVFTEQLDRSISREVQIDGHPLWLNVTKLNG